MRSTIVVCCAALLLSACANRTAVISMDSENVLIGNVELARTLTFGDAHSLRDNGRVRSQVTVSNLLPEEQFLEYQFHWYDIQGLEVDNANSPWHAFRISANESAILKEEAPNNKAVDFRVSIRKDN